MTVWLQGTASACDGLNNMNKITASTANRRNRRGRPRFVVSKPQIEGLQELGFSWISNIARMTGISNHSIQIHIRNDVEFDQLEDHGLDRLVASVIQLSPNSGEVMV